MCEYMKICHVLMNHDTVGHDVGLLKLMKLVYISHGFLLAIENRDPYIGKDEFRAWDVGPILPELHWAYRHDHGDERSGKKGFRKAVLRDSNGMDDEKHRAIVSSVACKYGPFSGYKLTEFTNKRSTPWQLCYRKRMGDIAIPDKEIKRHYDLVVKYLKEIAVKERQKAQKAAAQG